MTNREIDALVAEKVMDLTVIKTTYQNKLIGAVSYYSIGEPDWEDDRGDMYLSNPLPSYTLDINAAWEVVEKLQSMDYGFILDSMQGCLGYWQAHFERDRSVYTAEASTPANAICLAALKAVGYDGPI